VFEKRELRRIFGCKREEVRGGIRMRWVVHVACIGEVRSEYIVFVGKTEGKRPFGRPGFRWEDNITIDLNRNRVGGVWTGFMSLRIGTQGQVVVKSVMNYRVSISHGIC
jgi:hypothetical protein